MAVKEVSNINLQITDTGGNDGEVITMATACMVLCS